jgi:hypothetical protein
VSAEEFYRQRTWSKTQHIGATAGYGKGENGARLFAPTALDVRSVIVTYVKELFACAHCRYSC